MAGIRKIKRGRVAADRVQGKDSPRFSVSIHRDDLAAIDRLRADLGTSRAELARYALSKLLECAEDPSKKQQIAEEIGT